MINETPSLKNTFDSLIFDLDGTLWDSTANVAVAWQAAKEQVHFIKEDITQQHVRSITGLTYDAIFETLFPYLDTQQRAEFKAKCAVSEIDTLAKLGGELYPDLEETLNYLKRKYRLFLVSNCQNGYAEVFFNHSGMHHFFEGFQCFGTKNQPKAENIIDVVNDYGLKAPVYIGDTQGDFEASKKAGVPFIFASYGFGHVQDGAIARVDSVKQLQQLL